MRTNKERVVMVSVQGEVAPPVKRNDYTVTYDGLPLILPGVGGITYNVRIGDSVMDLVGDHVEPGVSTKMDTKNRVEANNAYNILSCIGNRAKIITGDAKGKRGYVTGKHGGIEHVLIDFEETILEDLVIGDKILIKAWGQGLAILDLPEVKVMNIDPELLEKMEPALVGSQLEVRVKAKVPPELMGSGLGSYTAQRGDYDITTADREALKEFGLDNLCFGDVVALMDTDNSYGRCFRRGAVSIGIVVHSNCVKAGHGPGVTTILTTNKDSIVPVIDENANLVNYLGLKDHIEE